MNNEKRIFNYHLNWKWIWKIIFCYYFQQFPHQHNPFTASPSQILFDIPSFWRKIPEIYAMNIITLGIDLALKLPNLIVSHFLVFIFPSDYILLHLQIWTTTFYAATTIITILYFQITIFFSCNVSEWYLLMNKQHSIWW